MSAQKQKVIPASAKTISLFTGRADVDDPSSARDGRLVPPKAKPPTPKRTAWIPNASQKLWELVESPDTARERLLARIQLTAPGEYTAWREKALCGVFPTLQHAVKAVEG